MTHQTISHEDFSKMELRVGTISNVSLMPASKKMLKLIVDFGEYQKQILAGIGEFYSCDDLVGRQIIAIVNLAPRLILGLESQGMLLAVDDSEGRAVLLKPEREVLPGALVK